ncbi:MAG TPA: tetratricopeptide repeat protein [Gemmatimonadaceae bacterium]|nr:tetratricopeptide repeat protein [Gemmatimonadaceae bacterium]
MSKVAQLKKQAAEFEQKKQFDKALALYVKLLDSFDEFADELDVGLFNRVGDLMLRQGNVADALDYYEKAVDHYAETGFFNNAIALCNKILRQSPGRASVYYKLGKISAQKGFRNDARVNFLEYADRMQKAGKTDEAFRALEEFADLSPDQDDIRLMIADQLTKAGRKNEAIEQLQILYARHQADGRSAEAASTAERIRVLDPTVEIKSDEGAGRREAKSSDLVFLDLGDAPPAPRKSGAVRMPEPPAPAPAAVRAPTPAQAPPAAPRPATAAPVAPQPAAPPPARVVEPPVAKAPPIVHAPIVQPVVDDPVIDAPTIHEPAIDEPAIEAPYTRADVAVDGASAAQLDAPLSGITRIGDDIVVSNTPSQGLLGLEQTNLADGGLIKSTPTSSLLDFEPTSLDAPEAPPLHRSSAPTHSMLERDSADDGAESDASIGGDLQFIIPDADEPAHHETPSIDFDIASLTPPPATQPPPRPSRAPRVAAPSPLDGLPVMDLDLPSAPPPTRPAPPRNSQSLADITDDLGLVEPDEMPTPPAPSRRREPEFIDLHVESMTIEEEPEPVIVPTPAVAHPSTTVARHSVEILQAGADAEPENWTLRRELAEAMLEAGDRDGGIRELESAMGGAERSGDLDFATSLAEELARLEPDAVRHQQKRVEYAFRRNDRPRLIEAYLGLGGALVNADQGDKARTVYQRVIDLAPEEARARAALDTLQIAEPSPAPPRPPTGGRRSAAAPQVSPTARPAASGDAFVNLGDLLRDEQQPRDTRMVVAEQEPTGDEEADFQDMLRKFKQGIAENVDPEDYQSHYDLAIAFKEMGLLDEAIAEFQKALGSATNRLPTYEALGECFLEKGSPRLALSILTRALTERASEEQLVGVLYLLGRASEELGNAADALTYYQRVFVLDIQFRDIAERMTEVERAAR